MAKDQNKSLEIIPREIIEHKIYLIRGQKVMLDSDLAVMYGVETKRLNEQVKRNQERFPSEFMFQLTNQEFRTLKSQIATSSWGGRRIPPYAFTEHGVAMLSGVLHSKRAIQVNILIIRAFIQMRQMLAEHAEIWRKIESLEKNVNFQGVQLSTLIEEVNKLLPGRLVEVKEIKGFRD